jgi:hypothetical protein
MIISMGGIGYLFLLAAGFKKGRNGDMKPAATD